MDRRQRRVLVIANPIAGLGRAASSIGVIEEGLRRRGFEVQTAFSSAGGECEPAASAVGQVNTVVAVGGDGTVNAVVRGILSRATDRSAVELPAVGVVPFGTGNVSMLAFGIPRRLEQALDVVATGHVCETDVGIVTQSGQVRGVFLLWLGAGIDAAVMHTIAQRRSGVLGMKRLLGEIPAATRTFARYPFETIQVEVEGKTVFHCASVMVANVGEIALLGNIAPQANPSDGLLEIVASSHRPRLGWLPVVLAVRRNRLGKYKGIQTVRARSVKLSSNGEVPVQFDGDAAGMLPVDVTIKPNAIRLVVP